MSYSFFWISLHIVMIIGFTQRDQTISEGDVPISSSFVSLFIDVATHITSERTHTMIFRHLESSSTAIVLSNVIQSNPLLDAVFGNENNDPIEERVFLLPGESDIPSRVTEVKNDFYIEPRECYTIGIFPAGIGGVRELFTCNDGDDATDFFCYHTICITDDDGKLLAIITSESVDNDILQSHLFLNLFKHYTLLLRVRVQWRCVLMSLDLRSISLMKLSGCTSLMILTQSTSLLVPN